MFDNEERKLGLGEQPDFGPDDFDLDGDDFEYYEDLSDYIESEEDTPVDVPQEQPEEEVSEETETDNTVIRGRRKKERKKERKKADKKNFLKKIKMPLILTGCGIVLAALVFFGFALTTITEGRVMNNVYIEGMDVSGLTYEETLAAVKASYLFKDSEITLTDGTTDFTINGADIGLSALPEQTAQKAMDYCKNDNIFVKAFRAGMLMFRPHVIGLTRKGLPKS